MAKIEEIVIIGGGPAGLAAAIYSARAGLHPLIFSGAPYGGQLMLTSEVENYPGFESILGPDLIEKMRLQAKKFGVRIVDKNIIKVGFLKSPFELYTSEEKLLSKSVNITTGAKAIWLGLESEQRLIGKGVSACATCDGFFFKDKVVAVVGGGDSAMEESLTLTKFASKIYLIHRKGEFRASQIMQNRVKNNPKIEILWNTEVQEVLGENKVEGVRLKKAKGKGKEARMGKDIGQGQNTNLTQQPSRHPNPNPTSNEELKLGGLFIAIGHKPDTDIFKGQIELDEKGYIITSTVKALRVVRKLGKDAGIGKEVRQGQKNTKILTQKPSSHHNPNPIFFDFDYQYMTSVDGVFAAGDCIDHVYRQAGTAVGMGIAAALEAEKWLENKNSKLETRNSKQFNKL